MPMLIIKYLVSAAVIVAVSEVAKHSDRLGALIASLPVVTLMVLFWLYLDGQPSYKLANHAWYTFWYALPTLPMFALFPMMLERWGFAVAMLLSAAITLASFVLLAFVVKRWGIDLW
ncbi:hypothetical protein A15D_01383 [Alcanivorax sp. MD8A]|uniref:DUF3147 family protein n=1 Tax=Alcanivorax sp. MD8A TaxID=1177157 RepID=UPI000C9A97E8|nr:DUF3147 family protein [Alcanivorax sp. MD8A]PNE02980.1 hypothetical protein A15D_01383 [Alcanivorax sp. MD8A]